MKKLTYLIDGEMILKYQVVSEDLDALVSVKSDEDVCHMFDEIDRYENAGSSRLRAFLFPVIPVVMDNQTGCVDDPHALEQRYIDAINGIIRSAAPNSVKHHHPTVVNVVQHGSSLVSSGCSSPRSPDSCTTEAIMNNNNEAMILQSSYYINSSRMMNMHKVQSSPNMCSMNNNVPPQQGLGTHHYIHQQLSSPQYVVHHYPAGYQSPKPPIDLQRSSVAPLPPLERLISVRSVGRAEGVRCQLDPAAAPPPPPPHYYSTSKQNRGNGYCCTKCLRYDDCSHFADRRITDRTGSLAISSVSSSTRLG